MRTSSSTRGYAKAQLPLSARGPTAAPFWDRTMRGLPSGCWIWTGGINDDGRGRNGYGRLQVHGRSLVAHRLAYEDAVGAIPDGLQVLHTCDTPPCINPQHLFLGTNFDNQQDSIRKGRARSVRGQDQPLAKLTESQVLEIREQVKAGATYASLASLYDVHLATIGKVALRRTWTHI